MHLFILPDTYPNISWKISFYILNDIHTYPNVWISQDISGYLIIALDSFFGWTLRCFICLCTPTYSTHQHTYTDLLTFPALHSSGQWIGLGCLDQEMAPSDFPSTPTHPHAHTHTLPVLFILPLLAVTTLLLGHLKFSAALDTYYRVRGLMACWVSIGGCGALKFCVQ